MNKVVPLDGFGRSSSNSNPLNFKVIAYATNEELNAAQPEENTIGVITNTKITSWNFSYKQPENMADGEVWFATGHTDNKEFNALKKNGIHVYPMFAKQHISGELVPKTAFIYQNGSWTQFSFDRLYFYNRGNLCEENSGGWYSTNVNGNNIQFQSDRIWFKGASSSVLYISPNNNVPFKFTKMVIVGEALTQINNVCFQSCGMGNAHNSLVVVWNHNEIGQFVKTIDISGVTDLSKRDVFLRVGSSGGCTGYIYEVYFQ